MPVKSDISKRTIHLALYAGYNIALIAWVLDYYKTPYDIAYLYTVEGAAVFFCAVLLLIRVSPFVALGLAALYSAVLYLMLWLGGVMQYIASQKIGEHSAADMPPDLLEPVQVLEHTLRPGTVWVLPLMLGGAGFLFLRHHVKTLKRLPEKVDVKAVVGHIAQRMTMLFWAFGASILYWLPLKNETSVIYGVLTIKLAWDFYENTRWFNPHNIMGIEKWPVRWGG